MRSFMQTFKRDVNVWDVSYTENGTYRKPDRVGWCQKGDFFIVLHVHSFWTQCLTKFGIVSCTSVEAREK